MVSGELKEYKVEAKDAYDLQKTIRNYGKRQYITGRAERGGAIVYTAINTGK